MITVEQEKEVFRLIYQIRSYRYAEKRAVCSKRYSDADAAHTAAEILKESLLELIEELTKVSFSDNKFSGS